MSTHSYTRELVDGEWNLNGGLHRAIRSALPGKVFVTRMAAADVQVVFDAALTAGEITTLAGVVAVEKSAYDSVEVLRAQRLEETDVKTRVLISQGFAYAGKVFSLSINAQSYWTNLYIARQIFTAIGGYPLRVNTEDDSDAYNVVDEADAQGLYLAAVGTVKARLGSGTVVKDALRAATTRAGIAAVVDDR